MTLSCRATLILQFGLLTACASTTSTVPTPAPRVSSAGSDSLTLDATYVNPIHRWSVSYPKHWPLDTQNLAFVRLQPAGNLTGLVGIHAGATDLRTAAELMDRILDAQTRSGQPVRILSRQSIQLVDGTPALLVDTELGSGTVGRSRRVAAVAGGIAYVIDAETYRERWTEFEPHADRIINSFRLNR